MDSCQQHFSMSGQVLLTSDSSKRISVDSLEGERPSKSRRVQFSDVSSMRYIEPAVRNRCDCNADAQEDNHESQVFPGNCLSCPMIDESTSDVQIVTKQRDGASAATLATQKLVRVLIKQKSISTKQVIELLLGGAPEVKDIVSSQSSDSSHCAAPDSQPAQAAVMTILARPDPSLCLQVIERLRALSNRIEKYGKAALLPCTTNLGPHFLPAIRFLASSVAVSIPRAALIEMAQG
jgi:hypothetical protein